MSIRVSIRLESSGTVIKVDGRLRSGDVQELARAYQSVFGNLILDLSELQSADSQGLVLLRELIALTSDVRGVSPYLGLLLKGRS